MNPIRFNEYMENHPDKLNMNALQKLKQEKQKTDEQLEKLREALLPFEKPITNLLLEKGKQAKDMSVSDVLQVSNLLIKMFEEVKEVQ